MDEYEQDIDTEYPTFNALNRKAMLFGVPLMELVTCSFVLVLLTAITLPFLHGRALFIWHWAFRFFSGSKPSVPTMTKL